MSDVTTASEARGGGRTAWVDARCGVAGDMLLAALLDAGADLDVVRRDVDAVLPGTVRLGAGTTTRGTMRASTVDVALLAPDQPHRAWAEIRGLLERADLPARVRGRAVATFTALAEAEGRVHGVPADDVHFHEVGAWDSVADVVGVCAALDDLDVETLLVTEVGVGDGFVRSAHGLMPVPVPAVVELLAASDRVAARGLPAPAPDEVGELATPTGVALLVALAGGDGPATLPAGSVSATGVGAGARGNLPWPNVVRVLLAPPSAGPGRSTTHRWGADLVTESLATLEATVDDLDPRAWPGVLADLLGAGARDAWLTPVLGKKGRPAHVVAALVDAAGEPGVRECLFRATSTLGVRRTAVTRDALPRTSIGLDVTCADSTGEVRIKIGHSAGRIVRATPEFEDAAALARRARRPVADALAAASAAAHAAGLAPGRPLPRGE